MNYYLLIKSIHIFTVISSITLFLLRAYWLLQESYLLKNKVIKILPHLIDTILLTSAIALLFIEGVYPGKENPWLIAKIIAMICYILTGFYLFKATKSAASIKLATVIAILFYIYIVHTAITKNINPFAF